ncbi:peptide ABC transporter ATP-binding protein [Xaviernesmea oryzae]|uniref:Peptide ABC transporter ATP-binding protein n=1 Tax=Xaviernesmea oryzae TaxID=464029 RepID=A0A1Q9AR89_9HYPH|nr:ABC transporter ATP-binding protein [Xaviernesmea oryzae]OLP57825.1 peptide ABC transporter ATP-binding protein [Xaviernesmea oryzae]SEL35327.1 peptide/nickel transport system ATP-binding protein [Xaviernesmea oryzae]
MSAPLLDIQGLNIAMRLARGGRLPIVNDLSLTLQAGDTVGIVGESGSGKSLLSLAVMGLLPPAAVVSGRILFEGRDLLSLDDDGMSEIRGRRIGMIFQEPMTALNPAMTVGDQIAEGLVRHEKLSWNAARDRAVELLDRVRIPDPKARASAYPHQMSGGQRQRVGIAIAVAMRPALMIADEPTTALDVTVQAEVLEILDDLCQRESMALMLISHDLGVIARMCARTLVLYAGRRMEEGATRAVLTGPLNPYTKGLLRAVPRRRADDGPLETIPGSVPGFARLPAGCVFSDRCLDVVAACQAGEPAWTSPLPGRGVRCIRAGEEVSA